MTEKNIEIKLLTKNDIQFGMKLKNIAGWNQIEKDWERFIDLEPEGCFLAVLDGEKVGTTTTTTYGTKVAWIGMVLVPPEKRRLGIGTKLLLTGIKYLEDKKIESIKLDATPLGKKVYDTLGFVDEFNLERRQGLGIAIESENTKPMQKQDLTDVINFDEFFFGVNRRNVITKLFNDSPDLCKIVRNEKNNLLGYIMTRPGYNAYQIGPWIAKNKIDAENLFKSILNKLQGQKIFFDVPLVNKDAIELCDKYNFVVQRGFIRMYKGENKYPGIPEKNYAISGVEKG